MSRVGEYARVFLCRCDFLVFLFLVVISAGGVGKYTRYLARRNAVFCNIICTTSASTRGCEGDKAIAYSIRDIIDTTVMEF